MKQEIHPKLERWEVKGRDPEGTGIRKLETDWNFGHFKVTVEVLIGDEYGVGFPKVIFEADSVTVGMLQDVKLGNLRSVIADHVRRDHSLLDDRVRLLEFFYAHGGTLSDQERNVMKRARREVDKIAQNLKASPPVRGRGATNPEWERKIAQLYVAMLMAHGERGVIQAMAKELDAPPNTVSGWVHKSRNKGWITDAPAQGKAGGAKGTRLIEWEEENS